MTVEFKPAVRANVPLLIGIAGYTGSGKTFSAMTLAKGLAGGRRFAVIDTENGRASHYADRFDFDISDLREPFRPEKYADAIQAAVDADYPVVVVDSMSHEYAGEDGLLDWAEDELNRLAGDDPDRRNALGASAWIKPKRAHKRMMSRLLQVPRHVILCFRAEEKIEFAKENGKTVVRPKRTLRGGSLDGWIPVTEKSVPYELTASFLLVPDAPGVPRVMKLEEDHRPLVPLDRPLSEETGRRLAEWAAGSEGATGAVTPPGSSDPDAPPAPSGERDALTARLTALLNDIGATDSLPAIEKHRQEHSPAEHVAYLQRCIDVAKARKAAA